MSMAYVIGITGGIGTGKSTVLGMLSELGARVLSADNVAKQILDIDEPAYREVCERFGDDVLLADGQINRSALGRIVFSDSKARADLDAITHPRIIEKINRTIEEYRKDPGDDKVFAIEIPLLMECNMEYMLDEVIVVAAEQETQIHRLTSRSGISHDEALRRIDSQMPMDIKVRRADRVIRNDADLVNLRKSVEDVWYEILLLLKE
ncbi:dephospho-CoA kinase [bacterium]|nr:dephospho-CoA kinase [bacterium]